MPNERQSVTELPPLGSGEVQVWRADLSEAREADLYMRSLSPAEAERAGRLRSGLVRTQFVAARACLRLLLGRHLEQHPNDVRIILNAYGKPEVSPVGGRSLFFNVAHSRATILIALCRESRVGIDLEYLDRKTDILEIARNSFTPSEFLQIEEAGNPAGRRQAFFRSWTRKEAVIKADGRGLSIPLSAVEVPVSGQADTVPVRIAESGRPASGDIWFVTDLELGDGIAGAFAANRPDLRRSFYSLPLEWDR